MVIEDVKQEENKAEQVEGNAEEFDSAQIRKARYWCAILWCENMIDDWQDKIDDLLQLPFAYCIHNKCLDTDGDCRKEHVHLMLAFPNTTTYNHALNVFRLLGAKAVNTCKAVQGMRNYYNYLIHDTEKAREQGKHQYDKSERVTGNNFDIGLYEQLNAQEVQEIYEELVTYIMDNGFWTITEFTRAAYSQYKDMNYRQIIKRYNATFERYCAGNFKDWDNHRKRLRVVNNEDMQADEHGCTRDEHAICCPNCGSVEVRKRGKTPAGTQRFNCRDCGKVWS